MELNIYCENEFDNWKPNEEEIIEVTKKIFNSYMEEPEIAEHCAITERDFKTVAFDILFCDSKKTHVINKEYRNKDYPADIITFAVFADSPEEEKFILDFDYRRISEKRNSQRRRIILFNQPRNFTFTGI